MARILALDYGTKRTGIAVTDELQLIASGLTTVATGELLVFLKEYLERENVEKIIVGEPKRMNNEASDVEVKISGYITKLKETTPLPIIRVDERFTSKLASRSLVQGGMKKKKRQDKALLDEISATIMLQDYLQYGR